MRNTAHSGRSQRASRDCRPSVSRCIVAQRRYSPRSRCGGHGLTPLPAEYVQKPVIGVSIATANVPSMMRERSATVSEWSSRRRQSASSADRSTVGTPSSSHADRSSSHANPSSSGPGWRKRSGLRLQHPRLSAALSLACSQRSDHGRVSALAANNQLTEPRIAGLKHAHLRSCAHADSLSKSARRRVANTGAESPGRIPASAPTI